MPVTPLFFLFFLLSGFCGLAYEIVWMRLCLTAFGVNAPVASMLVSTFMAGLTGGAWAAARLVVRLREWPLRKNLRIYAFLELSITLLAAASPWLIDLASLLNHQFFSRIGWGSTSYFLISGIWILVVFFPTCLFMGCSFPVGMAIVQKSCCRNSEFPFSYLYVANVLGAVFGSFLSAFILIEIAGFRSTILAAAAVNAVLGLGALLYSFYAKQDGLGSPQAFQAGEVPLAHSRMKQLMLFTAGFASMGLEIIWLRQYKVYFSQTIYAFSSILCVYLFATFMGAAAYRRVSRQGVKPNDVYLWFFIGLASFFPLLFADADYRPSFVSFVEGWVRLVLGISPFCYLTGFLTALLVDEASLGDAQKAGSAYVMNLAGCVLGPIAAGFVLLPHLGVRNSLIAIAASLWLVGLVHFGMKFRQDKSGSKWGGTVFCALTLSVSLLIVFSTKTLREIFPSSKILTDYEATVIAAFRENKKQLLIDGYNTTELLPATKWMAHLSLAFAERRPARALVICFGMGTTFRSLRSWDVETTAVELVPSVPKLFGYFHDDAPEVLNSPAAKIVIDDGRRYLNRTQELYDAIIVDPPPPLASAGSSLLYSVEFYSILKKRLAPGGILHQWMQSDPPLSIRAPFLLAVLQSFKYVRIFKALDQSGFHILASDHPILPLSAGELAAKLPEKAVHDLLEWGDPGTSPQFLFENILAREVPLQDFVPAGGPFEALRDDRPVNEYFFVRGMIFHQE